MAVSTTTRLIKAPAASSAATAPDGPERPRPRAGGGVAVAAALYRLRGSPRT
ncbi:hypothetical protein [Sorangium sp. So ce1335]|uniref:hypothetical protein n=1 Tax=Sorangium sp. So ce1335 TaxID=3133335 RepID=UPI003F63E4E5